MRKLIALGLILSLAACGGGSADNDGDEGFSASVTGTYGEVSVKSKPSRVVALNPQVAQILVALGVQPVAVAVTDKELADGYPWLVGTFTGPRDEKLIENTQTNLEKVASYRPDLIVGASYNIPEKMYPQATDIAPTFAGIKAANDDWDDIARAIGTLVGVDAAPVVDGVAKACAEAQKKLPGLKGRTYQWVATGEGQYRFGNGTWLECFGLKPAANQDNTQSTNAAVSQERIEELNADVLAIFDYGGDRAKVEADPRFAKLPSKTKNLVVWTDLPLANATNSPSPQSFGYLIEKVVPMLEASPAST